MSKKKSDGTWYKRGVVFKPADKLLIKFADTPSEFEVVEVNKRKNLLNVKVIVDHYTGIHKFEAGSVVNIGKEIFEGYWFFKLEKAA